MDSINSSQPRFYLAWTVSSVPSCAFSGSLLFRSLCPPYPLTYTFMKPPFHAACTRRLCCIVLNTHKWSFHSFKNACSLGHFFPLQITYVSKADIYLVSRSRSEPRDLGYSTILEHLPSICEPWVWSPALKIMILALNTLTNKGVNWDLTI